MAWKPDGLTFISGSGYRKLSPKQQRLYVPKADGAGYVKADAAYFRLMKGVAREAISSQKFDKGIAAGVR